MSLFSRSNSTNPSQQSELSLWLRGLLLLIAIALAGLLVVARTLQPDPNGHGTHQQLFDLPPCGFLIVFGYPCPSCGMTTAWALATRGSFVASMHANFAGFLLAILAMLAVVVLIWSALVARWVVKPNTLRTVAFTMMVIVAALVHWLVKVSV